MVLEETMYKNTKVYFRFLPNTSHPVENIKILDDRKIIYIRYLQDLAKGKKHEEANYWKFVSDGVFFNESQENIFKEVADISLFDKVLDGGNAAIICFGQTCSGKSITASALDNAYEDRGLIPRVLQYLFDVKKKCNPRINVEIKIKYVETSRNYIVDLLSSDHVVYDVNSLNKISTVAPRDLQDALKIIFQAEARKTIKSTEYYNSNMANSVITVIVTKRTLVNNYFTVGKLCIVDLCGVDTIGNESCYHKNGFEVGNGNLIKSQLDQFAMILNTHNTLHSNLTHRLSIVINYLNDILKSPSMLRFIGHLRLTEDDLRITLSMFRFGDCIRCIPSIKTNTHNFSSDEHTQIKKLKANLAELKHEKDLNCMLNNDNIGETSQNKYQYVEKLTQDYLQNKNGELVILNTSDAVLAMKIFKEAYKKVVTERDDLMQEIRKQEESLRISKLKEPSSSKVSKKSTSITSLIRNNKTSRASVKKQNSRNSALIRDRKDSHPSTIRSKRTSKQNSKIINRKISKRQSNDAQVTTKKSSVSLTELPNVIPSSKIAWEQFIVTEEYQTLNQEYARIKEQAKYFYETYLENINSMKKIVDMLSIRKEELFKATLLKDLDETLIDENYSPKTELELQCVNNVKLTEQELVQSKEILLKTQTDLNLCIQERNILNKNIDEAYEKCCKQLFNTVIPMVTENTEIFKQEISQVYDSEINKQLTEEESKQSSEQIELCKSIREYNKLKQYFIKEFKKGLKEKEKNQKWIQSCKLI